MTERLRVEEILDYHGRTWADHKATQTSAVDQAKTWTDKSGPWADHEGQIGGIGVLFHQRKNHTRAQIYPG